MKWLLLLGFGLLRCAEASTKPNIPDPVLRQRIIGKWMDKRLLEFKYDGTWTLTKDGPPVTGPDWKWYVQDGNFILTRDGASWTEEIESITDTQLVTRLIDYSNKTADEPLPQPPQVRLRVQ